MNKKFLSILFVIISLAFIVPGIRGMNGQVVCFGDSITYGGQVDGKSWVYFLSHNHTGVDFVNEGKSGRKTTDKEQLLPILKQYSNAGFYLIFLGVNDLKDATDSLVANCVANMRWMITAIRKFNNKTKIVILAPSDINLETMNEINVNKKYNQNTKQALYKLEKKYRELAKEEHTGFISLLHAVSKPNYIDGLHPNIEGQKEIAKTVWKGLKKIID